MGLKYNYSGDCHWSRIVLYPAIITSRKVIIAEY